jgi:ABC-type antimicrobial peptide transport system permease subunit
MLQLFFVMDLDLFPLGGHISGQEPQSVTGFLLLDLLLSLNGAALLSTLQHLTLPALTLAYPAFAIIVRFTRSGVLDVVQRDFITYEKAMSLPRRLIIFKYLLRNALTSTVAQIGLLFGSLLAGAVVTEQVFDWPGLGLYAVESIVSNSALKDGACHSPRTAGGDLIRVADSWPTNRPIRGTPSPGHYSQGVPEEGNVSVFYQAQTIALPEPHKQT